MPKIWHSQNNFTSGQLSPRLLGRVDIDKYSSGAKQIQNWIVLPHGGVETRSGFNYVAEGKLFPTGSDLITNGTFDSNITSWTDKSVGSGSIAHSTNLMNIVSTNSSNYGWAEQGVTTTAKAQYQVTVTVGTGSVIMRVGTATGGTDVLADTTLTTGARTVNFVAESSTSYIGFYHQTGATHTIDTVVVKAAESKKIRLKRFEFSTTQAYVLEFGDLYFRVYKDEGQIVDGTSGEPIEVTTTYAEADLFDLKFAQDADTLYIAHPSYAPRKITRSSHTSWTIAAVSFTGSGFPSDFAGGSAGAGSDANNDNPGAVTFFQERLWWGGSNNSPQKIWASKTGDFENMDQGTGLANEGLEYVLGTNDVNFIRWLKASESMLIGTVGAEFRLSANGAAVTPSNVLITRETNHGSNTVDPVVAGRAVLFIQRNGRKLRQLIFDLDVDGFVAPDLTILAENITTSGENTTDGIVDMDYQQELDSVVWCTRDSGSMAAMTYDRDQRVIAWHEHTTDGNFESVAVIPDPPNEEDLVWVVTNRVINGVARRFIEYKNRDMMVDSGLTFATSNAEKVTNGDFDSNLTGWNDVSTGSGTTVEWNPLGRMDMIGIDTDNVAWAEDTLTVTADVEYILELTVGGGEVEVRIGNSSKGAEILSDLTLGIGERFVRFTPSNTTTYLGIRNPTTTSVYIDSVSVKEGSTTLSGLDHLEGRTVKVTGNGNRVLSDATVSNGSITASESITSGTVGLGYTPKITLLRPEFGVTDGKSIGRVLGISRTIVQIHETNSLNVNNNELTFRLGYNPSQEPPPRISDFMDITALGYSKSDNETSIQQLNPSKATLLSVTQELSIND